MKEISKMRLGVLHELKQMHKFLDHMERSVKTRNPTAILRAYTLLKHMVNEMERGNLAPDSIALDVELAVALHNDEILSHSEIGYHSIK